MILKQKEKDKEKMKKKWRIRNHIRKKELEEFFIFLFVIVTNQPTNRPTYHRRGIVTEKRRFPHLLKKLPPLCWAQSSLPCLYKRASVPILSQINPFHALLYSKIYFNIILPSMLGSTKRSHHKNFPTKNLVMFFSLTIHATYLDHHILHEIITE